MHFMGKFVLTAAAALAMLPAGAATASAASHSDTASAGGTHVELRLGGLRATVHADNYGAHEHITGRLLGIDQSLTIGFPR